ncbi:MAG: NADH-quinone oxidoreductase subunit M [Thaumarchaeota archaeon]|nr:NADH-quinone oxidoreductase subunit M [Nitrososphaerota archaeon]
MIPLLSLLVFIPLLGSPLVYLVATSNRRAGVAATLLVALVVLVVAAYVFWSVYTKVPAIGQYDLEESYQWISTASFSLDFFLGVDGLSSPLVLAATLLTVFVIVGSSRLIGEKLPSYLALLLLFEGAILGVFTSLNLVVFYVFWELVMIPMFLLIGVWGGDRRGYAAMKFMIFIFVGSAVMLLSFLSAYLDVSPFSFDIPTLAGRIPPDLQYLPLLASFIGFGVKLPVFPLHSWLPDAYVQAPSPVTTLLAGIQSAMGGYGLIRISIGLFPHAAYQWAWAFMLVGLVTMFYGALVALRANELKRMFAFTSLNHMGFVIFGAFATVASGSLLGMEGAIFQMFVHAFTAGSLFMLAGYVQQQAGTTEISRLKGLRNVMPRTAGLLVVASAAAMALPPFASFLAELFVIAGGIAASSYTAVVVLVPVLTGGYLLWMIKRVVLSPAEPGSVVRDMPWSDAVVLALYFVPLLILIVFSSLILAPAAPVAQWVVHIVGGT